jgi:hypothetical protein
VTRITDDDQHAEGIDAAERRVVSGLDTVKADVAYLARLRAWEDRGYATWPEYVAVTFPVEVKIPPDVRRELVTEHIPDLNSGDLSQRDLAEWFGVSQFTISGDLKVIGGYHPPASKGGGANRGANSRESEPEAPPNGDTETGEIKPDPGPPELPFDDLEPAPVAPEPGPTGPQFKSSPDPIFNRTKRALRQEMLEYRSKVLDVSQREELAKILTDTAEKIVRGA